MVSKAGSPIWGSLPLWCQGTGVPHILTALDSGIAEDAH